MLAVTPVDASRSRRFAEIARILRPGGVFAAYQYEKLQTPYWEPEAAWGECAPDRTLNEQLGVRKERPRWPISVERIEESGQSRLCRELYLHSVEEGDAERLVGFALSEGSTTTLLERRVRESELGLDAARRRLRWLTQSCAVVAQLQTDRRAPVATRPMNRIVNEIRRRRSSSA